MVSLVAMLIIGTTHYWLDNRKDVHQPLWLAGFALWYITIIVAISFVIRKIRLGYLIAGLLSWGTLALWLLDNYSFVFHKSLIASEPNMNMVIRNFVGIAIASFAIIASHNGFHKIRSYLNKDRPV